MKKAVLAAKIMQTVVIVPTMTGLNGLEQPSRFWRGPPSCTSPAAIRIPA
jgi:hypothetical protein